ncbi:SRPK2.2 family protein [Megaselia abdita]
MMVNPVVCRKETFLEIVNSVPNKTNKLFKDLENFFQNTVIVDVKILLDICILVFISFVFVILVKLFTRNADLERKSRVELDSSRDCEESVEETSQEEDSSNNDSVLEDEGVTLEVEENKRKKVQLVKRKSVSAAPNLQSYRLKHAKPKLKILSNLDILQYISQTRDTELNATDETYPSPDSSLYASDEEQEDATQYCRGGYHPVTIGDIFDERYRIVRKLGWGHFSTVWLCKDTNDEKYVALKVVKSAPHYMETAADEIRLLEAIRDADPIDIKRERIVKLLNNFTIHGVNGVHTCLVFEALGCSLYKLIVKNNYQGLGVPQVKNIVRQVLQGLDYLHTKCRIIHTDVKPENILLIIDNAAVMNQQIDSEITSLCGKGIEFPDSYVSSFEKQSKPRGMKWPKSASVLITNNTSAPKQPEATTADMNSSTESAKEISNDESSKPSNNEEPAKITAQKSDHLSEKDLHTIHQQNQSYTNIIHNLISNPTVRVKLADLGNACYDYHHFTEDIQTRQYRSVEVLLGAPYSFSADIWSTACLAFELATGDYLFDPHAGDSYSRDEDHLAHIIELLGTIPSALIFRGKHALKYFTKYGSLRNITKLKPWSLLNVLTEKYDWHREEAQNFTDFLLPMLDYNPVMRSTASKSLKHAWLDDFNSTTDRVTSPDLN